MCNITVSFFYDLRNQLTNPNRKTATWEDVAKHCEEMEFDIFPTKKSRAVSYKINNFKQKGIPEKIQLKFQLSKFCQDEK